MVSSSSRSSVGRGTAARAASALALAALVACDPGFENPTEVIDLRPLAMVAEPPEQVLDIDLQRLPTPEELLAKLRPVNLCGLVGDPIVRPLRWKMTVCVEGFDVRCDEGRPKLLFGEGMVDDPETSPTRMPMCARIEPTVALLLVLQSAIEADPLAGFSGIDLLVSWEIEAEGEPTTYVGKRVRFAARVPAERTANRNPLLIDLKARVDSNEVPLPLGRCADQDSPVTIRAGERLTVVPVEPQALRERYVVPTFEGEVREFTETIEYQWYTSNGTFGAQVTGGRRDLFGNLPPIDNVYRARDAKRITEPVDAEVWIVQRDERLGEAWFETCIRVLP